MTYIYIIFHSQYNNYIIVYPLPNIAPLLDPPLMSCPVINGVLDATGSSF